MSRGGRSFPDDQYDDYRNAITWTQARPEVDADRIGIWGSSYSGGHVLHVAAFDRRVKCAAGQVPLVDGLENVRRLVRADNLPGVLALLNEERAARATDPGKVSYFPVVDPDGNCVLPTPDSYTWFTETGATRAPNWKNEMTWESVEKLIEYRPGTHIHLIAPTPLLMVVASDDVLTPTDLAAFQDAREPKKLVVMPGGHFDAYLEPHIEGSAGPAIEWYPLPDVAQLTSETPTPSPGCVDRWRSRPPARCCTVSPGRRAGRFGVATALLRRAWPTAARRCRLRL